MDSHDALIDTHHHDSDDHNINTSSSNHRSTRNTMSHIDPKQNIFNSTDISSQLALPSTFNPLGHISLEAPSRLTYDSSLPYGWNIMIDPYGRTFYVNVNAKYTQWEHPISNESNRSQYRLLPELPPHYDEIVPYMMYLDTKHETHVINPPSVLWTPGSEKPQQIIDKNVPYSSVYYHEKIEKLSNMGAEPSSQTIFQTEPPHRLAESWYTSPSIRQSLWDSISRHTLLSILTCIFWCVSPLLWFHHFSISTIASIIMLSCLGINILFIALPAGCLPCFWPWCGRTSPCIRRDLHIVEISRVLCRNWNRNPQTIIDKIEKVNRCGPVIHLNVESWHYEDESLVPRNRFESPECITVYDPDTKRKRVKVPSYRARRIVPIVQYKDVSAPIDDIKRLIDDTSYNILSVSYSSKFELMPIQNTMLELYLKEYYYLHRHRDIHTDVSMTFSLAYDPITDNSYYQNMIDDDDNTDIDTYKNAPYYQHNMSYQRYKYPDVLIKKGSSIWLSYLFLNPISFFIAVCYLLFPIIIAAWDIKSLEYKHNCIKYIQLGVPVPSHDVRLYEAPRAVSEPDRPV